MLCFHSLKSHRAWKMRNRITAHWKFIDHADPENTNNYLSWNLTSFSQLTGSHACSPLCPCLPAEMYNWAKGMISKKQVLYYWDGQMGAEVSGKAPPRKNISPASPSPSYELISEAGSLWVNIHTFFPTPWMFKTHVQNMYKHKALCRCHAKYRMESCTGPSFREMAI